MYVRQEYNNRYYYVYKTENINDKNHYKIKMILYNEIPGALPVSLKIIDGDKYLCFDVSSKEPLAEKLRFNKIGYDEIKKIIVSICYLASGLDDYLINYDSICLDEEYIYLNNKRDRYEFIINPCKQADFFDGIKNLIQKMLPFINHDDKKTVMITYGLMDVLDMVNVTVKDIEDHIRKIEDASSSRILFEERLNDEKSYMDKEIDINEELDMVCEDYDDVISQKKGLKEVVIDRLGNILKKEKQIRESKYKERPKLVVGRKGDE